MQFVLTTAGQLLIQSNPGVAPVLQAFKLGSGFGYTPNSGQTDLVGVEVHSGTPSNPVVQASNLVKYTVFLDFSLGNFNFGEVALYAPGNVLFAIGTSTTQIPKVKSTVNTDGNSLSIDCYVTTSGTTYSIYAELGNSDININIPALPGIDTLPPAYLAIPNTYQVSSPGQLASVLAFSNNSRWSVTGYDTEIHPILNIAAGSTASTLVFTQVATNPTTVGELLIQGVTGLNAGSIRVISGYSAGTNAYSVTNSFMHQPEVGDAFSVVRRNYLSATAINFLGGLNTGVGAGQTNGLQSIDLNKIFMTDGSRPAINNLNFADYRLTNVGTPIDDHDAVHKLWVADALDSYNTSVVTPIANAARVQIGIGAPLGSIPTTPPFYADKSVAGRYDLYINDPSTLAWTRVYPTDAQYGSGAPVLGTTPSTPTVYYDTSVSTRYIPYIFRAGDWHRVGYVDPGINFTGGVTITDSLAVGVSAPNPLNMTGGGFQTSNTLGINFDMKSIGINAPIRNRWTSTYAMTLNTSNNETGTYELCRNNTAFGGMRIVEDGTVQVGTKGLNSFQLIYNNAAVASVSTGFFDIFPTYNAGGQLRVNSKSSIISGINLGSRGSANSISIGSGSDTITGIFNIGIGYSSLPVLTSGNYNTVIGTNAANATTIGSSNTVLGAAALSYNVSGSSNVAIGDSCLASAAIGVDGRTAIGSGTNSNSANTVTIGFQSVSNADGQISIGYRAKGGTSSSNIAIGTQSMELAAASDFSIAIGYQSLRSSSGIANVAVGYQSFSVNTTGIRNIGVGAATGLKNTTGSDNTLIGSAAGTNNTTGTCNVAIGSQALWSNTTGNYNTAVGGYNTLNFNTSGSGNVGIGYYALSKNTTGNSNIAIGHQSSLNNTIGVANCSIGDNALALNTTGNSNVAIGYKSLAENTGGNSNIALGTLTLTRNTTGYNNIAIGEQSLNSSVSSNTLISIGSRSLYSISNVASNLTVLGSNSCEYTTTAGEIVSIGNRTNNLTTYASASVCIGALAAEQVLNIIGDVFIGAEAGRTAAGTANGVATNSVYIGRRSAYALGGANDNAALGASSFEYASSANSSVGIGSLSGRYGTHSYMVEIGSKAGSKSGTYNTSVLIGHSALGDATSVGTISQSTIIGARTFESATVNNISNSIILGDSTYNSGGAVSLNRIILLDAQASSRTASNEVTIGNGLHTAYRMYAAGWSNVSDSRDKRNIRPITEGIDLINKINPVRFEWDTRDGTRTGIEDSGFIAQQLQEALGGANDYLKVVNESNPEHLMVTKDGLYPVIIKALQELSAENRQLRADIDSLLGR